VLLWAALVGVSLQFFLNMEIERWTLATGETAIAGFARLWKTGGAPSWRSPPSSRSSGPLGDQWRDVLGFLFGLSSSGATWVAIARAVGDRGHLTASPWCTRPLRRSRRQGPCGVFFLVVVMVAGISARAWGDVPQIVTGFGTGLGTDPRRAGRRTGAGRPSRSPAPAHWQPGAEQLDPGQGIRDGSAHPAHRLTGHRQDVALAATGKMVRQDEANLVGSGAGGGWRTSSKAVSFWFVTALSIFVFSMLAYSTVFLKDLPAEANLKFIQGMAPRSRRSSAVGSHHVSGDRRREPAADRAGERRLTSAGSSRTCSRRSISPQQAVGGPRAASTSPLSGQWC